jgi:hypothetical protein
MKKNLWNMFQVAFILVSSGLIQSCVSSIDSGVEETDPPYADSDYYRKYQSATRGGDIIHKFDIRYKLHATYLSPEFRSALVKRVEKLYLQDAGSAFQEASTKAGFIVTVYGLDRDTVDLTNTNHWTLLFETKEGPVKPVLVKKITDKVRWRNFFETMSPWSFDYRVVFDRAAVNPNAENLYTIGAKFKYQVGNTCQVAYFSDEYKKLFENC